MERMGVPALVREDRVLPWVQEDELLTTGEGGTEMGSSLWVGKDRVHTMGACCGSYT